MAACRHAQPRMTLAAILITLLAVFGAGCGAKGEPTLTVSDFCLQKARLLPFSRTFPRHVCGRFLTPEYRRACAC